MGPQAVRVEVGPSYLEKGRLQGSEEPGFMGTQDQGQLPSPAPPPPPLGQIPLPPSPENVPFALLPPLFLPHLPWEEHGQKREN